MQLPLAPPGTLQVPAIEVQQRFTIDRRTRAGEQRPYVDAVEGSLWQRRSGEFGHSRQNIDRARDAFAYDALGNAPRESRQKRLAHAAFVSGPLAAAQRARTALVPGTVVGAEHHQRVGIGADA